MNNQNEEQQEAIAIIGGSWKYPSILELYEDLSTVIPATPERGEAFATSDIPPWIQIVLLFASTTVATSILNKLGEDIYAKLKSVRLGWFSSKKKKRVANFRIIIIVDGLRIEGNIPYELNSKEVINILKSARQMLLDAYSKQNANFGELEKSIQVSAKNLEEEHFSDSLVYPERVPRSLTSLTYRMSFKYEYDASVNKWKLISINKQE